jgi:hypothetical protein
MGLRTVVLRCGVFSIGLDFLVGHPVLRNEALDTDLYPYNLSTKQFRCLIRYNRLCGMVVYKSGRAEMRTHRPGTINGTV